MASNSPTSRASGVAKRGRTRAAACAAIGALTVGALAAAAPAAADDTFVAIAYSADDGAHGWVNDRTSEPDAAKAAEIKCRGFGGHQCVTAAVARDQCAAVAVMTPQTSPDHKWGQPHSGFGPDIETANAKASAANGGGEVIIARCSTGDAGWG
jgi:hypothetical protein